VLLCVRSLRGAHTRRNQLLQRLEFLLQIRRENITRGLVLASRTLLDGVQCKCDSHGVPASPENWLLNLLRASSSLQKNTNKSRHRKKKKNEKKKKNLKKTAAKK
jgi:hypothetical protein